MSENNSLFYLVTIRRQSRKMHPHDIWGVFATQEEAFQERERKNKTDLWGDHYVVESVVARGSLTQMKDKLP